MIYIETPRLILRSWKEEDIEPFAALNSSKTVMKYFLSPLTEKESLDYYRRIQEEFFLYGYGLYAVQKKLDGAFIGYTGFHTISFDVDFAPGIEIDWRLRQEDWNQGFATEAAQACLSYAKEHLPFQTIWSFTSLPNTSSERVMQKIGMKKIKEFNHPAVPDAHALKQHVLYKISLRE